MRPSTRKMLDQHIQKLQRDNAIAINDLAAAFLDRHGIDPELAQVVQEMKQAPDGWVITTYIKRRTHGVGE